MSLRIAYYGNFKESWGTENYIFRALDRAGVDVERFQECDTSEQLIDGLAESVNYLDQFDVFLFAKGRFSGDWDNNNGVQILSIFPEIRKYCKKIVCWIFDLLNPDFSSSRFQWASQVSSECDLFCTTDGSTAPLLFNCKVLRQGIGDDVRPGKYREEFACDVLFLGEAYGQRSEFLDTLYQHFHRRLWYVPRGYRGNVLNDVMASAKIVVAPPYPYYPGYFSNRYFVVPGYGGRLIGSGTTNEEEAELLSGMYIDRDNPIVELEDEIDFTKYHSGIPTARQRAITDLVRKHHTYSNRVEKLLEWIA